MKKTTCGAWILVSFLVSSCAAISPPERPAYTGSDSIQSARSSQLVGTWMVNDLNPYPDVEPQSTIIEYREDGTVEGSIVPQGESSQALGNMQFRVTANWSLDGDTVTHEDVMVESANDNAMGSLVARMIGGREGLAGSANIYELSANRIVMVGSDGAAMEYLRQ